MPAPALALDSSGNLEEAPRWTRAMIRQAASDMTDALYDSVTKRVVDNKRIVSLASAVDTVLTEYLPEANEAKVQVIQTVLGDRDLLSVWASVGARDTLMQAMTRASYADSFDDGEEDEKGDDEDDNQDKSNGTRSQTTAALDPRRPPTRMQRRSAFEHAAFSKESQVLVNVGSLDEPDMRRALVRRVNPVDMEVEVVVQGGVRLEDGNVYSFPVDDTAVGLLGYVALGFSGTGVISEAVLDRAVSKVRWLALDLLRPSRPGPTLRSPRKILMEQTRIRNRPRRKVPGGRAAQDADDMPELDKLPPVLGDGDKLTEEEIGVVQDLVADGYWVTAVESWSTETTDLVMRITKRNEHGVQRERRGHVLLGHTLVDNTWYIDLVGDDGVVSTVVGDLSEDRLTTQIKLYVAPDKLVQA